MPILATTPVVQPAKTYDQWWMHEITIMAPNPANPALKVRAMISMAPLLTNEDGTQEMCMDASKWVQMNIADIMELVKADADVATAMSSLLNAVAKVGKSKGVL